MNRILVWFSCGAASAVAAKLITERYPKEQVQVLYCDTSAEEHSDNIRFRSDVERWIGAGVITLKGRYSTPTEVFEARRFMSGPHGAPCTVELKKRLRFDYQQADDYHVFGYTVDEVRRKERFERDNPELELLWPLIDAGMTKDDCKLSLSEAGIELPEMYKLGYANNNCKGCVKATSPHYWNKIRQDFPEIFQSRSEQSRRIGSKLARVKGKRIYLDELQPENIEVVPEDLSCGPQCGVAAFVGMGKIRAYRSYFFDNGIKDYIEEVVADEVWFTHQADNAMLFDDIPFWRESFHAAGYKVEIVI